ncbi:MULTISPECIES: Flp family type IVb pilin [Devosia]|uniref:Flp family type IVb pilin n=1 Tax=Devosia TaxID=46913 RepID=UPI0027327C97|nr:Flp family type IVb pilin [Devosia sp.]MDP2780802.1 Flp family type IVb pilin [Devosia sp.]HLV84608.1 Flp family type IVb pilin [Devosia sp.]
MLSVIQKFARDETGITPVEYGLIAAIVVVAATMVVSAAGYNIHDLIGNSRQN